MRPGPEGVSGPRIDFGQRFLYGQRRRSQSGEWALKQMLREQWIRSSSLGGATGREMDVGLGGSESSARGVCGRARRKVARSKGERDDDEPAPSRCSGTGTAETGEQIHSRSPDLTRYDSDSSRQTVSLLYVRRVWIARKASPSQASCLNFWRDDSTECWLWL